MQATIDISCYPLHANYRETIYAFIDSLKSREALRVETDGMRTQISGEYDLLMRILQTEMKEVLEENKAVFVIKLARGDRSGGR